jgi:hypothetical protein
MRELVVSICNLLRLMLRHHCCELPVLLRIVGTLCVKYSLKTFFTIKGTLLLGAYGGNDM